MESHRFLWVIVTALCFFAVGALAMVPSYINYQGTLTDSSGNPITGTESMMFSLYADSAGGLSLWSETQVTVEVNDGLFQVLLGGVTTFPGSIFSGQDLWLETTIGGETLTPRSPFGTVAYSYRSANADTADIALTSAPDNDWTISDTDMYSAVSGNVGVGDTTPSEKLEVNGTIKVTGSGSTEKMIKIARYWDSINSHTIKSYYDSGSSGLQFSTYLNGSIALMPGGTGNVGVGTISPQELLDVAGTIQAQGIKMPTSASAGYVLTSDASGNGSWQPTETAGSDSVDFAHYADSAGYADTAQIALVTTPDNDWIISGNDIYSANSGNAGIGTANPDYKFHVEGQAISGVNSASSGLYSTVSGGIGNSADSLYTTVSGGRENTSNARNATVSGGWSNAASGYLATVGGGKDNNASNQLSTVGGGYANTGSGRYSTVSGGESNTGSGNHSTVSGGSYNNADSTASTVSGGSFNNASDINATVGGGRNNIANGYSATVGGGNSNIAEGYCTVIAGGCVGTADGENSAVGGGSNNVARGLASTVPGGMDNVAEGDYTVAMGRQAQAIHNGSFVWADGTGQDFHTTSDNQFLIRASGGVGIGTTSPQEQLDVAGKIACSGLQEASDRRLKTGIEPITDALCKIEQLQGVSFRWNNNAESVGATPGDQQIGLIAQEVEQVFPELVTSPDDAYKSIDYTKLTAILIEAVKELKVKNEELCGENQEMKQRITALEKAVH